MYMPNVLAYTCNLSAWEVDKGQSGEVSQPGLYETFPKNQNNKNIVCLC